MWFDVTLIIADFCICNSKRYFCLLQEKREQTSCFEFEYTPFNVVMYFNGGRVHINCDRFMNYFIFKSDG